MYFLTSKIYSCQLLIYFCDYNKIVVESKNLTPQNYLTAYLEWHQYLKMVHAVSVCEMVQKNTKIPHNLIENHVNVRKGIRSSFVKAEIRCG